MIRVFVGIAVLYILSIAVFTVINISLIIMRVRSLDYATRSVIIFGFFPVLIFSKEGRSQLKKAINF